MPNQPSFAEARLRADQRAAVVYHVRRVLRELIDLGSELARLLQRRIGNPAAHEAAELPELAARLVGVARAVRSGIRLMEQLETMASARPRQQNAALRSNVLSLIRTAVPRLTNEALGVTWRGTETLEHAEPLETIESRLMPDHLAAICRDLGHAAPLAGQSWRRRTALDLAALCEFAAGRGPVPWEMGKVVPLVPRNWPGNRR